MAYPQPHRSEDETQTQEHGKNCKNVLPGNPATSVAHLLCLVWQIGGTNMPLVQWPVVQWNLGRGELEVYLAWGGTEVTTVSEV